MTDDPCPVCGLPLVEDRRMLDDMIERMGGQEDEA